MKLVIVHYHLRPGGIRRVIELATPYLIREFGSVTSVTLACGEAADEKWIRNFSQLIKPALLKCHVDPALGYYSEQQKTSEAIRANVTAAVNKLLNGANAANCLVWAHNLGIGRNLPLTQELARVCAAQDVALVSHHHDWWFDNRWPRWPEIRRSGFRTVASVAKAIFPPDPNIRHVGINHEEAALLKQHLPKATAWLPNPALPSAPPKSTARRAAHRWLERTVGERNVPIWILPCRMLRRKNIAEALLLTRWLRPEAWLVTTGGASSPDEQSYFDKLACATREHHWHLRLGVLQGNEEQKPSVPELLAASEAVLLTSIQEGFGLPYVEAAAARRPLIARNLPNIAPDLHRFGFRFPQAYDELLIRSGLFDWEAERARQEEMFARWRRLLPLGVKKLTTLPALIAPGGQPEIVPFSRLTLTAQLEVLKQPRQLSWELCAPLNPFLRTWQTRAAAGKLKVTSWPRTAARWLSGESYAHQFARLVQTRAEVTNPRIAFTLQTALLEKKLCPANLYPLLWTKET